MNWREWLNICGYEFLKLFCILGFGFVVGYIVGWW